MDSQRPQDGAVEGIKFDHGKVRWALLPWKQVETIVLVLMHGATVYSDDNWQRVPNARTRYFEAALRHIKSRIIDGERLDPKSGLPHLAHAACCILFLMWFDDVEGV